MRTAKKEYAVYKGDCIVCMGTVEECSEALHIKPKSFHFLKTPTYRRRIECRKNPRNYITVIDLDDEDE